MSQIDQAFIQAYAPETELSAPPPGVAPPLAAEPIPAPHFQMESSQMESGQMESSQIESSQMESSQMQSSQMQNSGNVYADTAALQSSLQASPDAVSMLEPATKRRPLSTFVEPAQAATTTFQPVFEVDAFRWPEGVTNLLVAHESLLAPVAEQLLTASEAGRTMVGIAGLRSGVGCSTVLMCLARLLADAGKSVAMVDGNFAAGNLAKSLGLEFDTGWEDVLSGRVPLAESVVRSINDQIALLPLSDNGNSPSELLAGIQTSVSAGVLRYHYDLVLFDLGAPGQGTQAVAAGNIIEHCRIDSTILVADTSAADVESERQIDSLMSLFGSTCLGVIGNEPATQRNLAR